MSGKNIGCLFFALLLSFFQSVELIAQDISFAEFRPQLELTTKPYNKTTFGLDLYTIRSSDPDNSNMFEHLSNLGSRAWVNHYFKSKVKSSFFVEVRTNNYIPEVNSSSDNEYRIGIQNVYTSPVGRFTFSNRLRVEDRILRDTNGTYVNAIRPRYKFKMIVGLNKVNLVGGALYFVCSDEIYFNLGSSVTGHHFFDQNVVETGFGYCISDYITLEAIYSCGYKKRVSEGFRTTNGLQMTLMFNNIFSGSYTKGYFHKQ